MAKILVQNSSLKMKNNTFLRCCHVFSFIRVGFLVMYMHSSHQSSETCSFLELSRFKPIIYRLVNDTKKCARDKIQLNLVRDRKHCINRKSIELHLTYESN